MEAAALAGAPCRRSPSLSVKWGSLCPAHRIFAGQMKVDAPPPSGPRHPGKGGTRPQPVPRRHGLQTRMDAGEMASYSEVTTARILGQCPPALTKEQPSRLHQPHV